MIPAWPKKLLRAAAYTTLFLLTLLRYGTTWLVLIAIALAIAFATGHLSNSLVTEGRQVLQDLSDDAKVSAVGTLLTVIGFFVAFAVARSSWRREARTKLRLEAATDLYQCMHRAASELNDLASVIETFASLATRMAAGETSNFDRDIDWARHRCQHGWNLRTQIVSSNAELSQLKYKHHVVITSQVGGPATIKYAAHQLESVVASFEHRMPGHGSQSRIDFIGALSCLDYPWWNRQAKRVRDAAQRISGAAFMTRTAAVADVFGMNPWRVYSYFRSDETDAPRPPP